MLGNIWTTLSQCDLTLQEWIYTLLFCHIFSLAEWIIPLHFDIFSQTSILIIFALDFSKKVRVHSSKDNNHHQTSVPHFSMVNCIMILQSARQLQREWMCHTQKVLLFLTVKLWGVCWQYLRKSTVLQSKCNVSIYKQFRRIPIPYI